MMSINDLPKEVLLLIFEKLPSYIVLQIASTCKHWYEITNDQVFWKSRCENEFSSKAIQAIKRKELNGDSWKMTYLHLVGATKKEYQRLKENELYISKTSRLLSDRELKITAAALTGNTALLHVFLNKNELHLNEVLDLNLWDVFGEELLYEDRHQKYGYELFEEPYGVSSCLIDFICLHQQQSVLDILYLLSLKEEPKNRLFWAVVCNQSERELRQITNGIPSQLTETSSINNYPTHLFELAAILGHFNLFKFLLEQHSCISFALIKDALVIATYRGHVNIVKCLHTYFADIPAEEIIFYNYLIEIAASHGEVAILQILLEKNLTLFAVRKAFRAAVLGNCHNVLEVLYEAYPNVFIPSLLNEMISETRSVTNPLQVLLFLFDKGAKISIGKVRNFVWMQQELLQKMVFCEIKIQSALELIKEEVESSFGLNYLVNTFANFFQSKPGVFLEQAYKLDPVHFDHRLEVLVANEACLYSEKIINKLISNIESMSTRVFITAKFN
ncbi:F-box-like domain-containing protein [Legionella brunensis]|uniref:Ankyrin repeats (3 copies) n=1 Tax=Legionella brunensis TaxID=29422 RepID=A0A0W0SDT6_9GAMM|nr:F-box-like domain-containing protein [Legionella brunensis]KTC81321.1 Ankyrin repeats (3 copies) [Legionella brunensis]